MARLRIVTLGLTALLVAACGGGGASSAPTAPTDGGTPAPATAAPTAEACATDGLETKTAGTLTVGTDNPAFPPYFEGREGGNTEPWDPEWGDPTTGKGFESAMAYAIAEQMGFTREAVTWIPIAFNTSFAPGPKDFDFVLQQISFAPERTEGVDFSDSYYDVNQALVSVQGSAIADATSLEELKDAELGAPIGTTSLTYIEDNIQPNQQPAVYDDLGAAVQDLKNGQVDGIVVDLPTAFFVTAVQIPKGVIVGQFPTVGSQEYFAMAFEKGSPLVDCVNLALEEMKADGTLDEIRQEWLADNADAPVIEG
jgi:polar amino acid transport system substrate-binding protein